MQSYFSSYVQYNRKQLNQVIFVRWVPGSWRKKKGLKKEKGIKAEHSFQEMYSWRPKMTERDRAANTLVAECAHFVLNSLRDWEPVEECKDSGYIVSVLSFWEWSRCIVLCVLEAEGWRCWETKNYTGRGDAKLTSKSWHPYSCQICSCSGLLQKSWIIHHASSPTPTQRPHWWRDWIELNFCTECIWQSWK